MRYIVSDANLIDVERGCAVEEHRDIVVDGGKIVRICAHGEAHKDGCKVIDASGKFVVPGLINAHVHLFGTGMPSKILGGGSAQQKVLAFVKTKLGAKVLSALVASSAKKQLLSGVTTVRTVGDFYGSDIALKRKTDAGKGGAKGLRMLVSGMAITVPGGHGAGTFARTSDTVEGLVALVDEVVAEGADLVKICVTGGVMDAKKRGEPGEVKMTFEQVKAVCDRAHALGKKVAAHVQSTEGVRIAALGGVDTIEHGAAPDEESVKAIKGRGGAFVVTYSPALPFARLSPDVTKMNEMCKFNSEIVLQGMSAGAKAAFDAGIDVGLGTDASCPFCTQYNTWREVVYVDKMLGVGAAKALEIATIGNARVLGIDAVTGSVAEGKSADLLILNGDPLKDLRALRDIDGMMAQGRYIKRPRPSRMKNIEAQLDELAEEL